jgi:ABC-2 type transport system ATP-binding protein
VTPAPSDGIVLADNLTVDYGPVRAVRDLDLVVSCGQVLGLLGGNGAGKSSTLRAIAAVNPPTSGSLVIDGFDLSDPKQAEAVRGIIGYCPDVGGLVRQSTVREHIGITLASRKRTEDWPYALELLEEFGLQDVLDRETHGFSHGMSRRLSVLLAALSAQRVLILDEPFDGVDPLGVQATMQVIERAKAAGLAVLVSTHLLRLLTLVSDDIAVMVSGRVMETAPAAVFADAAGEQRYEQLLRGENPAPAGNA